MENKKLEIQTAIQISRPVHDVFEAIINPEQMSNYFISKGTGKLEEGKTLMWSWPEMEGEYPVKVIKVEKDKNISFYWGEDLENENPNRFLVEIKLNTYKNAAVVKVSEKAMPNNEEGIKWLIGNTEGWANFLASMKAWLEYGVHLRKGAFDFRFDKNYGN